MKRDNQHNFKQRAGLTLIELLMALAIMAMIGLTISSMLSAVAYGTSSDHDVRQLAARGRTATLRLNAALRGCVMVLDAGPSWLLLWQRDTDGNAQPSLEELRLLTYDATTQTFGSYRSGTAMPNQPYDMDSDFDAVAAGFPALAATLQPNVVVVERWAVGVDAVAFTLDHAAPQSARRVAYRLSLAAGGLSDTQIGSVLLRNAAGL